MSDDEDAVIAFLMKKASITTEPNFQLHDVEIIAEPWTWLMALVRLKAKKGDFQGLFGSPGPYMQAFQAALHHHYGGVSSAHEQTELSKLFLRMFREYLTWSSSGRRLSELQADCFVFVDIVNNARTILDEWDARRLAKISNDVAKEYRKLSAITRLPLSKRAQQLAMRKNYGNGTNLEKADEKAGGMPPAEGLGSPIIVVEDGPKVKNRPNPVRRQRARKETPKEAPPGVKKVSKKK